MEKYLQYEGAPVTCDDRSGLERFFDTIFFYSFVRGTMDYFAERRMSPEARRDFVEDK